jgi:hypothetical protein
MSDSSELPWREATFADAPRWCDMAMSKAWVHAYNAARVALLPATCHTDHAARQAEIVNVLASGARVRATVWMGMREQIGPLRLTREGNGFTFFGHPVTSCDVVNWTVAAR